MLSQRDAAGEVAHDSAIRLSGYIVERIRPDGVFAWTADFMADGVEAATE